jgi:hypothetical protein
MKAKSLGFLAAVFLAAPMAANAISFTFTDAAQIVERPAAGYVDIVFAGTIELGAGEGSVAGGSVTVPVLDGDPTQELGVGWLGGATAIGTVDRFFVRVDSADVLGLYRGYVGFRADNEAFSGFQPFTLTVIDSAVPEPGTLALLLVGLAGLALGQRRRA